MPRLELFRNGWPDIELILQVSIPLLDVTAETADLEIRYGAGGYADIEHRLLLAEQVTPACSPAYLNEFGPFDGFASEAEIQRVRLLRSPLEPWSSWFGACGLVRSEPQLGGQFNDLGLVYDAAASGFGVALVRLKMAAAWLDNGRLVRLSARSTESPFGHYICWQPGALERWECAAFVDWLTQAI
jgi:DNA-binding transcriptional LysR family regulator